MGKGAGHSAVFVIYEPLLPFCGCFPSVPGHASNGTETLVMRLIRYMKRLSEGSDLVGRSDSALSSESSASAALKLETARCLGELSTPNLHTVAMTAENHDEGMALKHCHQFT